MAADTAGQQPAAPPASEDAPVAAAAKTAGAKELKPPPPEAPADTRRRSYIVLSFWVIVLLLGIPFWWHTTSIYRADLPLEDMLRWANGKVRHWEHDLQRSLLTCPGLPPCLPPPDLHQGRRPPHARRPEPAPPDAACSRRPQRLLGPPSASAVRVGHARPGHRL